ncbi:MAG: S53 family peptidase [Pseudomonadota bacterium]
MDCTDCACSQGRAPSDAPAPLDGSAPRTHPRAIVGRTHRDAPIDVHLHLRHRAPLPLVDALAGPDFTPLSPSEFCEAHGADPVDVAAVESFARENALSVTDVDPTTRRVSLRGQAWQIERAFGVELLHASHPQGVHRTHRGPVQLPPLLRDRVRGVFGLDDRRAVRSHARRLHPDAWGPISAGHDATGAPAAGGAPRAFVPTAFETLYRFPEADASGQSIGIVELGGGYTLPTLAEYFRQIDVPMPNVTDVAINGGGNHPGQPNDLEVYLDIEVLGALAPGADLVVYFAPGDNASFLQAVQRAIHDPEHDNSVVSISWAGPEDQWTASEIAAMNEVMHEAAVRGVTVCVSTGDFGARAQSGAGDGYAHVEFPASSPFVLACGGTRVIAPADTIFSETAWNDATGATGGGVSRVFPVPAYQYRAGLVPRSVNPPYLPGRGVPDVAGNADEQTGYALWFDDRTQIIGGTSAVAPLWSALIARLNHALDRRLGFVHPALYAIGAAGQTGAYRDVVAGNNANARFVGGYWAGPGWDACTGWGSPDGAALEAALAAHLGASPADDDPPDDSSS